MAAEKAAVTSSFFKKLIEYPPLSVAFHRRCGREFPSGLQ
jgi:hypothetical protein